MSFQTCMTFFYCGRQKKIFWKFYFFILTMKVKGIQCCFKPHLLSLCLKPVKTFFKVSSFIIGRLLLMYDLCTKGLKGQALLFSWLVFLRSVISSSPHVNISCFCNVDFSSIFLLLCRSSIPLNWLKIKIETHVQSLYSILNYKVVASLTNVIQLYS